MTAPAMDERREVASRLRALIGGRINWTGLQCAVFGGTALRSDTVARLADLMDPGGAAGVDAGGLLALADALGGARNCCDYFGRSGAPCGDCPVRGCDDCQAAMLKDAAKRIRECVGDASERPQDAAVSPKTCDRQSECGECASDAPAASGTLELANVIDIHVLLTDEDREALAWVREHGGLESVKERLDWVVGHCSTKQQLDFDFWLSGRVMHELGFDEDMADRDEVEGRLLALLMPEGMCWPVFEDGEPVRIGDVVSDVEVRSVVFRDGGILLSDCTSVPGWGTWRSYKEPIKRPAPKVLDADGVEIREGDTVWHVETGEQCRVVEVDSRSVSVDFRVNDNGTKHTGSIIPANLTHRAPVLAADGKPLEVGQTVWHEDGTELKVLGFGDEEDGETLVYVEYVSGPTRWASTRSLSLTHTKPEPVDTWERVEGDAAEFDEAWAFEYGYDKSQVSTVRDLVRRCRALAERGK